MKKTNYGFKKQRESKYIIVAPHAAGDDTRTGELAEKISKLLGANLIVNNQYIKRSNSRASSIPNRVEDFNKLSWSNSNQRYLWSKKHPHMREFYTDIAASAKQYAEEGSIIVYIHGVSDNTEQIGIDIGFGVKYHNGKLKCACGRRNRHPEAKRNTGVVRAKRSDMEQLRENLEEKLSNDQELKVGIGKKYAAWSRQDGIQYHARSGDTSFQLEISSELRNPTKIDYTSKLIANTIRKVYGK